MIKNVIPLTYSELKQHQIISNCFSLCFVSCFAVLFVVNYSSHHILPCVHRAIVSRLLPFLRLWPLQRICSVSILCRCWDKTFGIFPLQHFLLTKITNMAPRCQPHITAVGQVIMSFAKYHKHYLNKLLKGKKYTKLQKYVTYFTNHYLSV